MVRQELDKLQLSYKNIQLNEVELSGNQSEGKLKELGKNLQLLGFELPDNKKSTPVKKIKSAITQLIQANDSEILVKKISVLLSEKLNLDYHYISGLFSSIEAMTIEKYIILQRIEKAKELLRYAELTLSEIADKLAYSSVQLPSLHSSTTRMKSRVS